MSETNPLPAAEAAAKEYLSEVMEDAEGHPLQVIPQYDIDVFLAGHAWTLQHLSEQGAGFDEAAARDQGSVQCSIGPLQFDGFMRGARWQHAQDAAVIAGLREEKVELERQLNNQNSDLARNFGRMVQENKLQQKEIAALKAELTDAKAAIALTCKAGRQSEAELERLRAELAEARESHCKACRELVFIGTDGCDGCETGRVTMYKQGKLCLECKRGGK